MSDITAAVLEPKNELICKIHIVVDSGLCEQNPYLSKSNMPDSTKEKLWQKCSANEHTADLSRQKGSMWPTFFRHVTLATTMKKCKDINLFVNIHKE